jgi:hypothetical protein
MHPRSSYLAPACWGERTSETSVAAVIVVKQSTAAVVAAAKKIRLVTDLVTQHRVEVGNIAQGC